MGKRVREITSFSFCTKSFRWSLVYDFIIALTQLICQRTDCEFQNSCFPRASRGGKYNIITRGVYGMEAFGLNCVEKGKLKYSAKSIRKGIDRDQRNPKNHGRSMRKCYLP